MGDPVVEEAQAIAQWFREMTPVVVAAQQAGDQGAVMNLMREAQKLKHELDRLKKYA